MYRWNKQLVLLIAILLVASVGLSACSGSASAGNKPVDVQVSLTEFKIDSSLTTFEVGVPYHFTVTNNGSVAHDFAIIPPNSEQLSAEQVSEMALVSISGEDLPAGATKELDYTFTQPYPSGSLEFACHLPGHYEAGMHEPIVVNE